jgi:hypothetical protein
VTGLDWIIVAFAALMAVWGAHQGFIVGVLSFAGFAVGAVIGSRLGPLLLSQGSRSPYAPAFGLFGGLLLGGILAAGLEGVGWKLRRTTLKVPGLPAVDAVLGALLSAAVGLGVAWIAAAVAAQAPGVGSLRADIQHSTILRALNEVLPPSGPILHALSRLDPLPAISGPAPDVPPPSAAIERHPAVHAAAASAVKVLGDACGLGIEGSGWAARPDWVVTNAHVVAGENDTVVQVGSSQLDARAIAFDPRDDVAVLDVPGLSLSPLALAPDVPAGREGATIGYPQDGPEEIRAARVGQTQTISTQDAYGNGPVDRLITPFRGVVRPGNSGGPVVDAHGRVLTTVFAAVTGTPPPGPAAGFGVANATVAKVLASAAAAGGMSVSTGPCAG